MIDAYRIELAETEMQTVLAFDYNAGYRTDDCCRCGRFIFGGIFRDIQRQLYFMLWKYTYLTMAAVMLVGIITTLLIREPQVKRVSKNSSASRLFSSGLRFLAVISFV